MKRYNLGFLNVGDDICPALKEDPEGDLVKYEDITALLGEIALKIEYEVQYNYSDGWAKEYYIPTGLEDAKAYCKCKGRFSPNYRIIQRASFIKEITE